MQIKFVERFDAVHVAQMLTYFKFTGMRVGLILNVNRAVLEDGIRRRDSESRYLRSMRRRIASATPA